MDEGTKNALMVGVPIAGAIAVGLIYLATRERPCMDGAVQVLHCPDGTQIVTHQCRDGIWIETENVCPPPACIGGEVLVLHCPDGTQIVTHSCTGSGVWLETGNICLPPVCITGEQYMQYCPNSRMTVNPSNCVDGQWLRTGDTCNNSLRIELTDFDTGFPLVGVRVVIGGVGTFYSDVNGKVDVHEITPGISYSFQFDKTGYDPSSFEHYLDPTLVNGHRMLGGMWKL